MPSGQQVGLTPVLAPGSGLLTPFQWLEGDAPDLRRGRRGGLLPGLLDSSSGALCCWGLWGQRGDRGPGLVSGQVKARATVPTVAWEL